VVTALGSGDPSPKKASAVEYHELQSTVAAMARVLLDITGWPLPECESSTTGIGACYSPGSGRSESSRYSADRVCDPCRAWKVLQESGPVLPQIRGAS
jgi:hypothetical protein